MNSNLLLHSLNERTNDATEEAKLDIFNVVADYRVSKILRLQALVFHTKIDFGFFTSFGYFLQESKY